MRMLPNFSSLCEALLTLKIDQYVQSRPNLIEGIRLIDSLDIFPVDEQNTERPSPLHLQYIIQHCEKC